MKLVFIDKLRSGMICAEDIFPPGSNGTPYVRQNTIITDHMICEMKKRRIRFVYTKERPAGESAGAENEGAAKRIVVRKEPPLIEPRMQTEAVDTLEDLFASVQIGAEDIHSAAQVVKHLDKVVNYLVDSILNGRRVAVNINDLKSYDEYTYHHSLSVAVLSIMVGRRLGFSRPQLNQIGMCAMMHDIGKTAVPIEIIHKTSRLDENEFCIVKNHSPAGYEYLSRTHLGDEEIWRGVLYHHEKMDGTGYPDGIKGEEIPLYSRIISVADVYDALTSNRPYRQPMQPAEAAEYVMGCSGSAFDYDVVSAFMGGLELYPVGTRVQLSGGGVGTILNNEYQLRPILRLETGEILDLYRDRNCRSTVISHILPD